MTLKSAESFDAYHQDQNESLEHLISIWPISTTIATHLPAGDLISLARASRTLRSYTHGFPDTSEPQRFALSSSSIQSQPPPSTQNSQIQIGNHQTPRWANLKSLAPFVCSFPSHKDPKSAKSNPCRPCKFCSRPICKTCIVRSFFTDPSSSKATYRYRARRLCPTCWSTGNLRKDFRYPADSVSREQVWQGRGYGQRGNWCACSSSEDNWVCGDCRPIQNASGHSNQAMSIGMWVPTNTRRDRQVDEPKEVPCYGLDCNTMITEIDRDRRRICLWCSKPLMRQFGGEDRFRWEEKQVEIRAAAAASRSADIYEWARNRFRSLTMSRRQMRGTEACIELTGSDGPEHDEPVFVRHLDAVNYRGFMGEGIAPSPDAVYQSKHGRWIYSQGFLLRVQLAAGPRSFEPPAKNNIADAFDMIKASALPGARKNNPPIAQLLAIYSRAIATYALHLQAAGLMDQKALTWVINNKSGDGYKMRRLQDNLFTYLEVWDILPVEDQDKWKPPTFWELALKAGYRPHELEDPEPANPKDVGSDTRDVRDLHTPPPAHDDDRINHIAKDDHALEEDHLVEEEEPPDCIAPPQNTTMEEDVEFSDLDNEDVEYLRSIEDEEEDERSLDTESNVNHASEAVNPDRGRTIQKPPLPPRNNQV